MGLPELSGRGKDAPAISKVIDKAVNDWPAQRNGNIRPAHSRTLSSIHYAVVLVLVISVLCMSHTLIVIPILDIFEIKNSGIVKVLTRKDNSVQVPRMSIRDWVTCVYSL